MEKYLGINKKKSFIWSMDGSVGNMGNKDIIGLLNFYFRVRCGKLLHRLYI